MNVGLKKWWSLKWEKWRQIRILLKRRINRGRSPVKKQFLRNSWLTNFKIERIIHGATDKDDSTRSFLPSAPQTLTTRISPTSQLITEGVRKPVVIVYHLWRGDVPSTARCFYVLGTLSVLLALNEPIFDRVERRHIFLSVATRSYECVCQTNFWWAEQFPCDWHELRSA